MRKGEVRCSDFIVNLENIKNNLIDRIKNEKLLQVINNIFDSTQEGDLISLNSEQIEMLLMSKKDIEEGRLISESELDKSDAAWLY